MSTDEGRFLTRHSSLAAVAAAVLVAGVVTTSFVVANRDDPDEAPTVSSPSPSTGAATPIESVSVPAQLSPTPLPDPSTTALASPAPGSAKADVAQRFVTFAVGGTGDVPWSSDVPIFYGRERVAVLTSADVDDPSAWNLCPANVAEYAGRECPVSPLEAVRTAKGAGSELTVEDGVVATLGCDLVAPLRDPDYVDVVSIRPGKGRQDCFTDFVVALYLDAAGQVAAVEFVVGSP